MIVDKPEVSRRRIAPITPPPPMPMQHAESRRPIGQSYVDCFDKLLAATDADIT
jgi:hypothetical protein